MSVSLLCSQGRSQPSKGLKTHLFESPKQLWVLVCGSMADWCNPGRLCGGGDTQVRSFRSGEWKKAFGQQAVISFLQF